MPPPKYALIDFLADIGGIAVLIFVCLTLILSFWNYNYMSDYLVGKLFHLENQGTVMSLGYCSSPSGSFKDLFLACKCKAKACQLSRVG